jgi:hypothetical protein
MTDPRKKGYAGKIVARAKPEDDTRDPRVSPDGRMAVYWLGKPCRFADTKVLEGLPPFDLEGRCLTNPIDVSPGRYFDDTWRSVVLAMQGKHPGGAKFGPKEMLLFGFTQVTWVCASEAIRQQDDRIAALEDQVAELQNTLKNTVLSLCKAIEDCVERSELTKALRHVAETAHRSPPTFPDMRPNHPFTDGGSALMNLADVLELGPDPRSDDDPGRQPEVPGDDDADDKPAGGAG